MEYLFFEIISEHLVIPAWQMGAFVIFVGAFMLARDYKLCLITTYIFTLYWGFFLYFGEVLDAFSSVPATLYVIFGCLHVGLTLLAFLQEKGAKY